ncbi:MAG: aspartyl/glutamyl-tRNA amidotransferase subunit C [Bacilli bacterium]|nr:aspartyl/glutamyl-tRNA amidotransferase subunit C [Bacilli bacterium]
MSKFTKEMVDSYAEKLLIGLTEEENAMVLSEFDVIDKDIDIVNTIEGIENVEVMTHALDNMQIKELREDIAGVTPDISDLLFNAKNKIGREIEVPKVVGNDEV